MGSAGSFMAKSTRLQQLACSGAMGHHARRSGRAPSHPRLRPFPTPVAMPILLRNVLAVGFELSPAAPSFDMSVVGSEEGFCKLQPEWDALVDRLELPSPSHSWDWNRVWCGVAHKDYPERDDHRAFLNEVAPRFAARGELKVGLLPVRGEVVAAQMWLERNRTLFLCYSGYLPEWSRYSVAMASTAEILKRGIARGLERVEFLRGTGQFKTRWDTCRRIQLEVTWARHAKAMKGLVDSYRSLRHLLRRARRLAGLISAAK